MRFYNRGGTLCVDISQGGKRIRKSLGVPYNAANVKRYTIELGKQLSDKPNFFLASSDFDLYKDRVIAWAEGNLRPSSALNYKYALKTGERYFKNIDIRSVGSFDIEQMVQKMTADGLAPRTISNVLGIYKMVFKEAIKSGVIAVNPVSVARKPRIKRTEYPAFNTEQVRRILECSEGKLRTFLYIAFYTGARAGEILGLKYSDIDWENGYIKITRQMHTRIGECEPKTGPRKVVLLEPLRAYLSGILVADRDQFIIKLNYEPLLVKFKALLKELGLPLTGFHSTRRTFIRLSMKHGVDLAMIQKIVGHRDLTMINSVYSGFIEEANDSEKINAAFNF